MFTPKHGSWLNLIESFFGKMARTMLRGIRVASTAELKRRIDLFFEELNADPVIFRWRYKLDVSRHHRNALLQILPRHSTP